MDEMKSSDLVHWCGRLKRINKEQYRGLIKLNRIRNACAHNWILHIPKNRSVVVKGKRVRFRVPRVIYNNKNLFIEKNFLDDFCPTYGHLYLALLFKVWRLQGKI